MDNKSYVSDNQIQLEKAAIRAMRCEQNTLVVAGPGAGKTELLAQKARYLFSSEICRFPRKILAISFKKDSAENLKERVIERFGSEYKNRFVSLTYDAFFKGLLDRFYRALPKEYSLNPRYSVIDTNGIVTRMDIIDPSLQNGLSIRTYKQECENMVKQTVIPIENNPRMDKFWELALKGNDDMPAGLSFVMISKLVLLLLQTNEYIKRIICDTYSHVFLDEFQDTTGIQYEIVKELFLGSDVRITAVGDNKQRIMGWAGAVESIFMDYKVDFNAHEYHLLMNYRSAPRLVELQRNMYDLLNEKQIDVSFSNKWQSNDGSVRLLVSENELIEAECLARLINADIKSGVDVDEICILFKQKVDLYSPIIIEALRQKGIRARVEDEYQPFIKDRFFNLILNFIRLTEENKDSKAWEDVVAFSTSVFSRKTNTKEHYYSLIVKINDVIKEVQGQLQVAKKKEDIIFCINPIISFFGIDSIKAMFPEYSQGDYLQKQLDKFCILLWKEYIISENNWMNAIDSFAGDNTIPMMTIHKSKGLEYSSVYFVGLEDSAFWNFKSQPEADRCAFFVALSRAKERVTFTYCNYRSNSSGLQKHEDINEFYDLLYNSGFAEIIRKEDIPTEYL